MKISLLGALLLALPPVYASPLNVTLGGLPGPFECATKIGPKSQTFTQCEQLDKNGGYRGRVILQQEHILAAASIRTLTPQAAGLYRRMEDPQTGLISIYVFLGYGNSGENSNKVWNADFANTFRRELAERGFTLLGSLHAKFPNQIQVWRHWKGTAVYIINSAFSEDDAKNRIAHKSDQDALSIYVKALARAALKEEGGVVYYDGHSRGEGGGFSFGPPKLDAEKCVDFPWYARQHPGQKFVADSARKQGSGPSVIANIGCTSQRWIGEGRCSATTRAYGALIRRKYPHTLFITTNRPCSTNPKSPVDPPSPTKAV